MFGVVRKGIKDMIPAREPMVVSIDDTLLKKSGKKTYGVSWKRDPMGPPFHVNFIKAQRFIQISAALPSGDGPSPARMIPIDLAFSDKPVKPKKSAPEEEWRQYRALSRKMSVSNQGSKMICLLREKLDSEGEEKRRLVVVADGGYTNGSIMKNLPGNTTFIGRMRKDAKLYHPPVYDGKPPNGRRRVYGDRGHTPEELRCDQSIPWQEVKVFAAGKEHSFRVKSLTPLLWRSAGPLPLKLVVIAPLAYRPRKGSRLLYRQPAFLICTDIDMPLDDILQYYVWRWDIEVNFRDEKQLIGMGEAQVHSESSAKRVPEFVAACYAMLLLSAHKAFGAGSIPGAIPPPKWIKREKLRFTTKDLISQLRSELWGEAIGKDSFYGFVDRNTGFTKPEKRNPDLASAVLYAA